MGERDKNRRACTLLISKKLDTIKIVADTQGALLVSKYLNC
jgi:hypothetical protein